MSDSQREFLKPLDLTPNRLAKAIRVPPNQITARLGWERFSKHRRNSGGTCKWPTTYDAEKALPAKVRNSIHNRSVLATGRRATRRVSHSDNV
jgi:hypothetical protein